MLRADQLALDQTVGADLAPVDTIREHLICAELPGLRELGVGRPQKRLEVEGLEDAGEFEGADQRVSIPLRVIPRRLSGTVGEYLDRKAVGLRRARRSGVRRRFRPG